jgi:hypothetical protein
MQQFLLSVLKMQPLRSLFAVKSGCPPRLGPREAALLESNLEAQRVGTSH